MLETPPTSTHPTEPVIDDVQAGIIEDARRRQRRHRLAAVGVIVAAVVAGLLIAIVRTSATKPTRSATRLVAGPPSAGALTSLHLAGALAVSPSGRLYIADIVNRPTGTGRLKATRVLVRLADGRFRVVVSNLHDISDLAFAPNGTLYIADAGWVREVGRNGVIHTIAGDGRAPSRDRRTGAAAHIHAGTRARSAPLGSIRSITRSGSPLYLAFGPGGQLYISTGQQILRLTAEGTLDPVPANVGPMHGFSGGQLNETGPIAVARNGTIYVGSLMRGWSLWAVDRDGSAHELGYARQSGGDLVAVQTGPHGAVYTEDGDRVNLIESRRRKTVFEFRHDIDGEYFALTNFAVAGSGVIYADEIPGGYGFEAHQQLLAVHQRSKVALLWQERNRAPG